CQTMSSDTPWVTWSASPSTPARTPNRLTSPSTDSMGGNSTVRARQACGLHDAGECELDEEIRMPDKETLERAKKDKREGKSPSTQAGEFVREEIHHVREGKHGARSAKQAIAI